MANYSLRELRRDPVLMMMLVNVLLFAAGWSISRHFIPAGALFILQTNNIVFLLIDRRRHPPVTEDAAKIDAIRAAGAC